mgnify:CR=1 FL=1
MMKRAENEPRKILAHLELGNAAMSLTLAARRFCRWIDTHLPEVASLASPASVAMTQL